jgi:two-component system, chemotaxis family, sensor kinase CheA
MSIAPSPLSNAARDFLAEAEEILEGLVTQLSDLADMGDKGASDPDLLNAIFRGAHSLKGLAGMFGFSVVAEVAHNTENLLDSLRMGKICLNPHVIDLLFNSSTLLSSLLKATAEGTLDRHSDEIAAHCLSITNCLAPPDASGQAETLISQLGLSDNIKSALTEYEEHRLKQNLSMGRDLYIIHASFDLSTFDQGLSELTEVLKSAGEVISTLPSVGENIETNIDFDLLFGSTVSGAELTALVSSSLAICTKVDNGSRPEPSQVAVSPSASIVAPRTNLPEQEPTSLSSLQNLASASSAIPAAEDTTSAKSMSRTVRVDIGKLDELMNIVGELVLAHSAIATITSRMQAEGFSRMAVDLGKAAKDLERKLNDLQNGVMDIRMIPVGQLYEKMSRIVRKISREQGKKIELKLQGADTELDKLIVEDIADPLMHIIRNAIDHGIESSDRRIAAGKDERGLVRISAYQKGSHVVIEVEDDGAGIDVARIRAKAVSKGLIQDKSPLSDREALELIFLPGFSTAEKVTDVSGRGVGMDVVKNNIAAVSGMVDIDTRLGLGTKFTITLPITLAIIKALIITCAGRIYAIPITAVVESLLLSHTNIYTVERKEVIHIRENTLPVLRLEQYFAINRGFALPAEDPYVVIVGAAEKRIGIVVDDLLGQQDIVIKPLGESFRSIKGISGAADLGDQRTILVLDVGGIINESMRLGG